MKQSSEVTKKLVLKLIMKPQKNADKSSFLYRASNQKALIIMSIPFIVYIFIFFYFPAWGWIMAFKNYHPSVWLWKSQFIGFDIFKELFQDEWFYKALRNTVAMSVIRLSTGLVAAVGFALILNEVKNMMFKRTVQTISYLPHFVSWVVAATLINNFLSLDGPLNDVLVSIGIIDKPTLIQGNPNVFWLIIALTDIWKEVGWNAIIYLAAITSIDPSLYEAAEVDGASRLGKIWHITLPGIMPVVTIILIMNVGQVLNTGFEQQMLLQNSMVLSVSEVIDLYVIRMGMNLGRFNYATAVGMFKSVVSIILLYMANAASKKLGGERVI